MKGKTTRDLLRSKYSSADSRGRIHPTGDSATFGENGSVGSA